MCMNVPSENSTFLKKSKYIHTITPIADLVRGNAIESFLKILKHYSQYFNILNHVNFKDFLKTVKSTMP